MVRCIRVVRLHRSSTSLPRATVTTLSVISTTNGSWQAQVLTQTHCRPLLASACAFGRDRGGTGLKNEGENGSKGLTGSASSPLGCSTQQHRPTVAPTGGTQCVAGPTYATTPNSTADTQRMHVDAAERSKQQSACSQHTCRYAARHWQHALSDGGHTQLDLIVLDGTSHEPASRVIAVREAIVVRLPCDLHHCMLQVVVLQGSSPVVWNYHPASQRSAALWAHWLWAHWLWAHWLGTSSRDGFMRHVQHAKPERVHAHALARQHDTWIFGMKGRGWSIPLDSNGLKGIGCDESSCASRSAECLLTWIGPRPAK